jgi:hypothetical protein
MAKIRSARHPVTIRGGKLFVEIDGEAHELALPWYTRINDGRLQLQYEHHQPLEFAAGHSVLIGFAESPLTHTLQRCVSCSALFIAEHWCWYCASCADAAAAQRQQRSRQANIERGEQRQAKRAGARCSVCGVALAIDRPIAQTSAASAPIAR